MADHTQETHAEHHEDHGSIFKRIIAPFLWLLAITVMEFILALGYKEQLTYDLGGIDLLALIFILMTLVKAAFIVGFFMHLKFEVVGLKWAIVAPMLFIVYLIALMIMEANHLISSHI